MTLNSMEEEDTGLEGRLKSEVKSQKPEEENNSDIEHPTSGIVNKSDPDSYRDREPKSEENTSAPESCPEDVPKQSSSPELLEKTNDREKSEIQNKSEIEIPHSEIQDMEVHHHPEVEKKGIKEYLLEGLMIFVAVMMGFFAESYREHINEQHQAQDYAVNLYNDLKADSAELRDYRIYFKFANANVDTLMQLLSKKEPKDIPSGQLYYFGLFGGAYHIFTPHDATLITLKSSGALRFFGDKIISRKLAVYDELCQQLRMSDEKENGIYVETRKARAKIFDFRYNETANNIYHSVLKISTYGNTGDPNRTYTWASVDSFKKTNPPLLSYDKAVFNEYVEMVRSRFLNLKASSADTLYHHAKELLGLLQKKYDVTGD